MTRGEEVVAFARSCIGKFIYTNEWWARMNPEESGGTDCSGFCRYVMGKFGYDIGTWTGDESQAGHEVARGHYPWEIPWDIMEPGDLILMTANYWDNWAFNEYLCHIEMYCGNGTMIGHPGGYGPQEKWAQAWMESYGCITWMVRRIIEEPKPHQEPGEPVNGNQMWYRVHSQALGWLDPVRDGQTAGTTGWALRGEAIKITPPEGMRLNVKTHIQDEGWRTYVGVEKGAYDPEMGTTGKSQRLECIEIDVTENPKRLKVFYRVHIADFGWTDWTPEGYAAGTVGCGKAIEAIQIKAV